MRMFIATMTVAGIVVPAVLTIMPVIGADGSVQTGRKCQRGHCDEQDFEHGTEPLVLPRLRFLHCIHRSAVCPCAVSQRDAGQSGGTGAVIPIQTGLSLANVSFLDDGLGCTLIDPVTFQPVDARFMLATNRRGRIVR